MAAISLEQRVAALEAELAEIESRLNASSKPKDDWLGKVWGSFANDPIYLEAIRLGRQYSDLFVLSQAAAISAEWFMCD